MLKGLSNIKLLGILLGLVAVYFIVTLTKNTKRSSSFRSVLVEMDTAKVDKLQITKNDQTLSLFKVGNDWKVQLENDRKVTAKSSTVNGALSALLSIKPDRLAAKAKSKWKDYVVDSSGTRVEAYEGSDKTLDLVIGRFGVQGQRQYHTFVRLFDENEVYSVNDFMPFSVNSDAKSYRESVLMRVTKDSIKRITFNYPDSGFVLEKSGNLWLANGQPTDSTSTAKYLDELDYLSNSDFYDNVDKLTMASLNIQVEVSGEETITLEAYPTEGKFAIHSSKNDEEYFLSTDLFDKVFKPLSAFIKS